MYIHEAISKTTEERPYIRRDTEEWREFGLKIWPTNTCECCVITSNASRSLRGWQPFKEDLLADDWIPCG